MLIPADQAPDAHKDAVREFAAPKAPAAPAALSSSEVAAELEQYVASEPDHAAPAPAAASDDAAAADREDVNAYLASLQEDIKVEAHH